MHLKAQMLFQTMKVQMLDSDKMTKNQWWKANN